MTEVIIAGDIYGDDQIIQANAYMYQSLDGNELQYNTLDVKLELGKFAKTPEGKFAFLVSADIKKYKYGAAVVMMRDGKLIDKFYLDTITRIGKTQYKIFAVSAIGLLEKSKHFGGVYRGISVPNLTAEIIGNMIPYTVDSEYNNVLVYGWLPPATRRENLHQLLFAIGASVSTGDSGDVLFTPFQSNVYTKIPDSRIYLSGNVKYPYGATAVSVYEHGFALSRGEPVTLFDGDIPNELVRTPKGELKRGGIVIFKDPCDVDSLAITNGTIEESGVNYAVLAPSMGTKLTGVKYVHTIREVNRPEVKEEVPVNEDIESKVTIANATLVSFANSEKVADRMYDFYNSAKTVNADILLGDERVGGAVEMRDVFGDPTKGIIQSMDVMFSGVVKASMDVIADYTPSTPGNLYTHVVVIDADGDWAVPENVTKIRAVIIGGGSGGEPGNPGEQTPTAMIDSESRSTSYTASYTRGLTNKSVNAQAKGGEPGTPGQSGKIHSVTLAVSVGQSFHIHIGLGGDGAAFGSNLSPQDGEDSVFGEYSSAQGARPTYGFFEEINGIHYAGRGEDGVKGGDGPYHKWDEDPGKAIDVFPAPIVTPTGTFVHGVRPDRVVSDSAGKASEHYGYFEYTTSAGYGGGPAYGANGLDGSVGKGGYSYSHSSSGTVYKGVYVTAGKPGDGATALPPPPETAFGKGGTGGNGGGGAGAFAIPAYARNRWSTVGEATSGTVNAYANNPAAGGNGSNGGKGAHGCVIIYY